MDTAILKHLKKELNYKFLQKFRDKLLIELDYITMSNFVDTVLSSKNRETYIDILGDVSVEESSNVINYYYSMDDDNKCNNFCEYIVELLVTNNLIQTTQEV
jgi:hypothetical protein